MTRLPGVGLAVCWLAVSTVAAGMQAGQAGAEAGQAGQQPAAGRPSNEVPFAPLAKVETMGSGPVDVVLLPDVRFDGSAFRGFMSRNRERYRMHALTPAGFGGTTPPPPRPPGTLGGWEENEARAVWKYMVDAGLEKPVLLGHGAGGRLAYIVAGAHPEAVRAVVAVNAWTYWLPPDIENPTREQIHQAILTKMIPHMAGQPQEMWERRRDETMSQMAMSEERVAELRALARRVNREFDDGYGADAASRDLRPEIARISAPVMMIEATGLTDVPGMLREMHKQTAREVVSYAPDGRVVFFNMTRHFAFDDRPEEFDRAVADFLAGKAVADVDPPPVGVVLPGIDTDKIPGLRTEPIGPAPTPAPK